MGNQLVTRRRKIAYLVSWFPARTETFILRELQQVERLGGAPVVYALVGAREDAVHPGAEPFIARTRYLKHASREVLSANLHWLRRSPRRYLGTWARAIAGNLRSPGFLARALYTLPKAAAVARDVEATGVEHVHAHWATHPALAGWAVHRLTGIPWSFTGHAHDLYVDRTMLRQKLQSAAFAVTISEFNRELLRSWYGPELARKVAIVRCGIDGEQFRPRTGDHPRPGPFILLCVASLRDYKGHPWLIQAMSLLKRRGHAVRLQLVGDGEDRLALCEQVAKAGLAAEVSFLGHQPSDRVAELMRESDAVVLPSVVTSAGKMEGIPVCLMEALACELPVVATRLSGTPELVKHGETGLLVPPADAGALAAAIERLIRDPALRTRLGRAGRQHVLAEFELRANAEKLYEMFMDGSAAPLRRKRGPDVRVGGERVQRPPEQRDARLGAVPRGGP
jgi:colanic acid/amylovoran biosynthesis glycosyltransferase